MAIVATTLSGAVASGDLTISVASATGAAKGNLIAIDNEFLVQTADAVGTVIPVRRGVEGTYNRTHNTGAVVQMGLPSEFTNAPAGEVVIQPYAPTWTVESYTVAGAISVPTTKRVNVYVKLSGGSATAMTLAAPGANIEGVEMIIQAEAAQAYTVTQTTPGFNGAGSSGDVATFGGAIGDNFHIKAVGGQWNVLTKTNVTIA